MTDRRAFSVACTDSARQQLERIVETSVSDGLDANIDARDVVFLAANSGAAENAFTACLRIKRQCAKATVVVLLTHGDDVSEPIARFCLADGVSWLDRDGDLADPDAVQAIVHRQFRNVPIDALLERFEGQLTGDANELAEIVERHSGHEFIDGLTDEETGLFDGPFATFKLDEEYKRALRFHQPLSLILFDCGADLPDDEIDRRTVLAEIASVFLNECRDIDTLSRFTETVFLFLLPGTGSDGAAAVARRMLEGLRERPLSGGVEIAPAAGIATVPMSGIADRTAFLRAAETCLRSARAESDGVCVL